MGVIMLVLFRKWTASSVVIVTGPYRVTAIDSHIPGGIASTIHVPGSVAGDNV